MLFLTIALLSCKGRNPTARGDDAGPVEAKPAALVGRWKADGSGRELEAHEKFGVVTFQVVKPSEWGGAYLEGETRFSLRADGSSFAVTDRYRPFDLDPGVHYEGESGRASCLSELSSDSQGKPLRAELTDPDTLSVDFAHVQVQVTPDALTNEVLTCQNAKVIGVLRRTLRKVPATP